MTGVRRSVAVCGGPRPDVGGARHSTGLRQNETDQYTSSSFGGERNIRRSVAPWCAAVETGRIGRPADKREFLPRFRLTIAGAATGAEMQDDVAALCAALRDEIGPAQWSDRDCVEILVARGQVTPERAEEWAVEHGEPPFEEYPDPGTRDPMGEPYWTLPMALAWIAWRTRAAVRMCWSSYVPRCRVWLGHRPGYRLMAMELPSIHDVGWKIQEAEVDGDPLLELSYEDAMHQLSIALKEGQPLIARHGNMNTEVIPARLWDALCCFAIPKTSKTDAVFDIDGKLLFERVRVDRDDVLAVWPALPATDLIEQVGNELATLVKPTASVETGDGVPATVGGSMPRITIERLREIMSDPRMDDTTNSNNFLSEARQRGRMQGYSLDQGEARALYKEMHGHKPAGRPGRKSRSKNPV